MSPTAAGWTGVGKYAFKGLGTLAQDRSLPLLYCTAAGVLSAVLTDMTGYAAGAGGSSITLCACSFSPQSVMVSAAAIHRRRGSTAGPCSDGCSARRAAPIACAAAGDLRRSVDTHCLTLVGPSRPNRTAARTWPAPTAGPEAPRSTSSCKGSSQPAASPTAAVRCGWRACPPLPCCCCCPPLAAAGAGCGWRGC